MKSLYSLFFVLVLSSSAYSQEWKVSQIGPAKTLGTYDLVIGEGRNDGQEHIYVSTKDGEVFEWTYDSTSKTWKNVAMTAKLSGLVTIDIGKVRNDGINRIYATEFVQGGRVLEIEFNSGAWTTNVIDSGIHTLSCVVGNGRNDGKDYLYIGSTNVGTWEYAWSDTGWVKTQMHFQASEGVGVVGESRNDGNDHLLFTSDNVKEYTWDGTKYTISTPSPKIEWPDAITIGKGRNDGINRIYANCFAGRGRVEYTWNGSAWVSTVINPVNHRGDIYAAAVKDDGLVRIYTTTANYFKGKAGTFNEYLWNANSSQYDSSVVLDAKSGATAMIMAGFGRNDDTMRLYATNYVKGTTYELTNKNPLVKGIPGSVKQIKIAPIQVSIYPNPTNGIIKYTIQNPNRELLKMDVLNFMGEEISLIGSNQSQTIHGSLDMQTFASGLYYLRIERESGYEVFSVFVQE